jgi:LCP family protein required for cell wall assembly
MDYVATGSRNRRSDALSRSYVKNVLLIGTDGRTEDEAARSDTMIIASINSRTDEISLISLMRDCYVVIPGYGENKLNAAYSFGGAELLMDTIEYNFGIAVEDYVSVNFVSFANVVDSVGGIDIEISDAEAQEINTIMQAEVNSIMGDDILDDLLDGGGELHLNGKQALSYARIRYIGNADFERTERQRRVIELVMDKVKSFNPTILPNVASSVLPGVETNMSTAELYWLSLKVPFIIGYDRQQLRIPAEETYSNMAVNIDGFESSVLSVDFNANYNIIYENAYSE